MYKDKDKQREANRQAQARFKAKQNLAEQGITEKVLPLEPKSIPVIPKSDTRPVIPPKVIPSDTPSVIPKRSYIGAVPETPDTTSPRPPGLSDSQWAYLNGSWDVHSNEGRPKNTKFPTHKRGKDIKHFGDLPMDVQASIDRLSVVDGKIDQTIKANRTAIAVNYQHQFPDRFHSTGVN